MTPEKTAKEIVDRFDDTAGHTKLAAAIAEAIADEREACAKVAEGWGGHHRIAADIRNRTATDKGE